VCCGECGVVNHPSRARVLQVTTLLALVGDATDGIPGVAGIGMKTAGALVREFGGLDALYANLEKVCIVITLTSLSISLCLSLSLSVSFSLYLPLSLSICLCLFLSLSFFLSSFVAFPVAREGLFLPSPTCFELPFFLHLLILNCPVLSL
jgi:hypothetical protein